ncbi:MAG: helix-turn-helix domain-containing protein [Pirellulaceae bacterium]
MSKISSSDRASHSGRSVASFHPSSRKEAVQMLLDGHTAKSVAERLGLSGPNLLFVGSGS